MRTGKYTAFIRKDNDVYVSECPEIAVSSVGNTPDESIQNLKEAIDLWLENAKELGI